MNRPDSRGTVFEIDYAGDPTRIAQDHPDLLQAIQREVVAEQGWVPEINDRLLGQAPTLFLDNPAPADRDPPKWRNTASGDADTNHPPAPRVGLLKAIPGNGKVTLRWDVAADQTWPVQVQRLLLRRTRPWISLPRRTWRRWPPSWAPTIPTGPITGPTTAALTNSPVTGLTNNALYRFAVRAEDGTSGAAPAMGRIGPGGGIEETNPRRPHGHPAGYHRVTRSPSMAPSTIGANVTAMPDAAGDGSGADFTGLSASRRQDYLYLYLQYQGNADPAKTVLLIQLRSPRQYGRSDADRRRLPRGGFQMGSGDLIQVPGRRLDRIGGNMVMKFSGNRTGTARSPSRIWGRRERPESICW